MEFYESETASCCLHFRGRGEHSSYRRALFVALRATPIGLGDFPHLL
jgi:hypothetical protein